MKQCDTCERIVDFDGIHVGTALCTACRKRRDAQPEAEPDQWEPPLWRERRARLERIEAADLKAEIEDVFRTYPLSDYAKSIADELLPAGAASVDAEPARWVIAELGAE